MSIKIMSWVWENSETSGSERLALLALADSANDEGYCWPSFDTIAKKCRLSRRYIIDIISKLEESGHIQSDHRHKDNGDFTSNMYRVVVRNSSLGSEQEFTRVVRQGSLKPSINHKEKEEETKNIFKLYESTIGIIVPGLVDELKEYGELPYEWIEQAFKLSVDANARKWAYVRTILDGWKRNGRDWKPGAKYAKPSAAPARPVAPPPDNSDAVPMPPEIAAKLAKQFGRTTDVMPTV